MNIQDLTTRDYIEFVTTFTLTSWAIIATSISISKIKKKKYENVVFDLEETRDELEKTRGQSDSWYRKWCNKCEQCSRLENEKKVLKDKVLLLESRENGASPKEQFNKHMPSKPVEKSNSRKGASSPSRRKEGENRRPTDPQP